MRMVHKYPTTWKMVPQRSFVGNRSSLGFHAFHFEYLTRYCRYVLFTVGDYNEKTVCVSYSLKHPVMTVENILKKIS